MTKKYVKPAQDGLVVRRPLDGQPLPPEGAWVDWSGHWARRKAEGSITEAEPPKKTKARPAQAGAAMKEVD
ncbi:DUF2635 domain-containing protein [Bordetella petrii]|uniref:Hypothetical phage-related protein n=1 Tax=Bordetella petrii (strain ATCC BAA-461 / DSM 12804 / CCUG 43448 / CIP 107267 / Se-1111R) TaxID=340100 RepID=A9ID62_BORPD|nr:DUF2635 domain-containing protein [Bordetella petrii]CAP44768.1 hypothetical phage-related protein [Bordetella petrii]